MWKELKVPFFTILFIFLGLLLYVKLAGPIPFQVNNVTTTKTSMFSVQGKGEVAAVPDTALITLGVNKDASTVKAAQTEVNKIINQITADIKKLGVEEKNIKTVNYSVNPNYDYSSGRNSLIGYSVSASIEVRVKPLEKANEALDTAVKDGATQAGGIQFVIDDKIQKELEGKARKEAIKNAKDKAADIAGAAGIKLGRIVDVQESNEAAPRPVQFMAKDMGGGNAAAESTELSPGENKVIVNVTLSYETY